MNATFGFLLFEQFEDLDFFGPWEILGQAAHCDQILSVCTGAFLLQAAGLFNGKKAVTHWASLDRLRQFPEVMVEEERFVRDGNIWTSAGISAGIDMALAFVSTIAGEKTAGDIQLQAEYYPQTIIYSGTDNYLPRYIKSKWILGSTVKNKKRQ